MSLTVKDFIRAINRSGSNPKEPVPARNNYSGMLYSARLVDSRSFSLPVGGSQSMLPPRVPTTEGPALYLSDAVVAPDVAELMDAAREEYDDSRRVPHPLVRQDASSSSGDVAFMRAEVDRLNSEAKHASDAEVKSQAVVGSVPVAPFPPAPPSSPVLAVVPVPVAAPVSSSSPEVQEISPPHKRKRASKGAGGAVQSWAGKRWHFTYKGWIDFERLKAFFKGASPLKMFSFVHEESDPEAPYQHTHAAVWFEKLVHWQNQRHWDFPLTAKEVLHPNWKALSTEEHWRNTVAYHKKEMKDPKVAAVHLLQWARDGKSLSGDVGGRPVRQKVDIKAFLLLLEEAGAPQTWDACLKHPFVIDTLSTAPQCLSLMRMYFDRFHRRPAVPDPLAGLSLRFWQQSLLTFLDAPPDPRKILFVCDLVGGCGKSSFALSQQRQHPDSVLAISGTRAGPLTKMIVEAGPRRVYFFDVARAAAGDVEYSIYECVKNGYVNCTFAVTGLLDMPIPHVVVFMNQRPDFTKLSADRFSFFMINAQMDLVSYPVSTN